MNYIPKRRIFPVFFINVLVMLLQYLCHFRFRRIFHINYELCRAYERTQKNTRFFLPFDSVSPASIGD